MMAQSKMAAAWGDRLSANLGLLWADMPLPTRIERAGAANFRAVELHYAGDWDAGAIRAACTDAGVRLLGVNTSSAMASSPERRAEFRAEFTRLLAWCQDSGAQAIHILAGTAAPHQRKDGLKVLSDNILWASSGALDRGIGILLEPLNRYDRPGYLYHQPDEVATLLANLGRPNVSMQFDAYHVDREGLALVQELCRHIGSIGHVQIAASPDRGEPDHGNVDYHTFFKALEQVGYAGFVGCEYVPRGAVEEGLSWRDRLPKFERGVI